MESYNNLQTKFNKNKLDTFIKFYFDLDNFTFQTTKDKLEFDKVFLSKLERYVNTEEPIEYICNYKYFKDNKYYVDENVLIPRQETEILVDTVLSDIKEGETILDIGTGSGCIAIEISKALNSRVIASDISHKALKVAAKNANNLEANIQFIESDLFINITEPVDVVVSNPPYIKEDFNLDKSVIDFEPHSALFAKDKDAIEFYTKIIDESISRKVKRIYFEIGYDQKEPLEKFLNERNITEFTFKKDYQENYRVLSIILINI